MHKILKLNAASVPTSDPGTPSAFSCEEQIERIRSFISQNRYAWNISEEDVVQNVMVELLEYYPGGEIDDEDLKRIVSKHVSREKRFPLKKKGDMSYFERHRSKEPKWIPDNSEEETQVLIDKFCETLSPRLRRVAALMFTHKNVDIAMRLGMAESNVSRDIKKLRGCFKEFMDAHDKEEGIHRRKPRRGIWDVWGTLESLG